LLKDFVWIPLLTLIGYTWNQQNKKIIEVKSYVSDETNALRREIDRERDVGAKLFDKLDEHAKRSEDRHIELLKALHIGLAQKADK
jgi:hypothetical protein